ncbi:hypothetical protein A3D78_07155 [Candidatus Gottesmanbacteria bacterium RIFCSPHIGHO2_02_FULL_39_14]|uniref:Uncharacterized protein n=3 Tax=Candidatus Gottesmaniibacteriota TaxID=1752720 RepID=A0A1F5ZXS2_9BACT|nr:MAG: hypothetical protein A3D78_07155 [Candidatus Gottesmanbacteria bacterium RIFCSPHIGHO2_02_FULL_39_14]OGG30906.1 MAG: hypothetical protein A3I51_04870 [Candidatus Gottesmanbacteria bacterium RIFCSPLOWO2_02_FULL_38_8]
MDRLNLFLNSLKGKNIHLIGASGSEGSSLLDLLVSSKISAVTAHDFVQKEQLEKNYKLWHKGLSVHERNKLFTEFEKNLERVEFHDRDSYLEGIQKADIVFVPQSWRLYLQNKPLFDLKNKNIPFYSLMRLYLDYSKAKIIAVTGTVGKGSVAYLIYQILNRAGKSVYFTGNETWTRQLAGQLREMTASDYLVLEVSHRQVLDGFSRSPDTVVFTNLYSNHLDEISWQEYCRIKLSLIKNQTYGQIAVINYDNDLLRKETKDLKSRVIYYSAKHPELNIKAIQNIYSLLLKTKSNHYMENILAASTVSLLQNIPIVFLTKIIDGLPALPARLEKMASVNGTNIYDDIKSTTPWSTLAALDKLTGNTVLIMGGETKGITYNALVKKLIDKKIKTIVLDSSLSRELSEKYPHLRITISSNLENAVNLGLNLAQKQDNLLISPAGSNFYSYFIKGKKSIRKIITSLLPKEPVAGA